MNERRKSSTKETCPQKNRTESKGYAGGRTSERITENTLTDSNQAEYGVLEAILTAENLNAAYKQVKRNKGAAGIDKMEVESLREYLVKHRETLRESIRMGVYSPNPVRRVEIPKENGKKRQLGIPTVVDRLIQQAISGILSPIYEAQFSEYSYGFRPNRSAHQALQTCRDYLNDGYRYVVDMDLEKFFDTVNHSKLIEVISRTVKDGRVISLIHKYLNAGVQIGRSWQPSREGVPQGGPLSPLLGNIMLNELDKELEHRGHKFVRYADDMLILCSSKRAAKRVMQSITRFIEETLFLKVNTEKTQVGHVSKVKFLGYAFYITKGEARLRVHPKSIEKMKARIKELTSRSNGWGFERRKQALRRYIIGWVNYFKLADMDSLLKRVDRWYRRRLRMVIWKQWKRVRTRLRNLIRLGVPKPKAWEWANTRKAYWHIANSFILSTTITTKRLRKAGYLFLSDYYQKARVYL